MRYARDSDSVNSVTAALFVTTVTTDLFGCSLVRLFVILNQFNFTIASIETNLNRMISEINQ